MEQHKMLSVVISMYGHMADVTRHLHYILMAGTKQFKWIASDDKKKRKREGEEGK